MGTIFLRLRTWWETADRTQKVVTIFGTAFLAILLMGTYYFASKPKMVVLYSGLSTTDMAMVSEELGKLGVPMEYDRSGAVLVPDNRELEARAKLAMSQKLPSSGHGGYGQLTDIGMMNTPRVEQERVKAAIEGELSRTIELVDGVASARVHLTLGEDSPFARDAKPASASIIVNEKSGASFGQAQAQSIAKLVQHAVTGLDAKYITVINSMGQLLLDGSAEQGSQGVASAKVSAEIAEAKRRESDLQRKLDAVFGAGNTVASVPVLEMNFDQSHSVTVQRTPSDEPLSVESNTESLGVGAGGAAGGPAGTAANTQPGALEAGAGGDSRGYTGTQKVETRLANEVQTTTEKAAGQITAMSLNVLVNKTTIKDVAAVESFISGYLGPKANEAGFSSTVTQVEFDTAVQDAAKKLAAGADGSARMQQIFSLIPVLALVGVGFMVMKAISKAAKSTDIVVTALPGGQMMPLPAGAPGLTASTPMVQANYAQPQLVQAPNGDLLQYTPGAAQLEYLPPESARHASLEYRESGLDVGTITTIAQKVNVPLEQIRKMAQDKPSVIAMLLKSWMLEDRR